MNPQPPRSPRPPINPEPPINPQPSTKADPPGVQALARAALTYLAEPGDPALGALLETYEPAEVLTVITAGRPPAAVPGSAIAPAANAAWNAH